MLSRVRTHGAFVPAIVKRATEGKKVGTKKRAKQVSEIKPPDRPYFNGFMEFHRHMKHMRAVHADPRVQRLLEAIDSISVAHMEREPFDHTTRPYAYLRFMVWYLEYGNLDHGSIMRYFTLQRKLQQMTRKVSKEILKRRREGIRPRPKPVPAVPPVRPGLP